MRALLVENDPHLLPSLITSLEAENYVVDVVADTETARQKLGEQLYSVILLDVATPDGGDGRGFVFELRQRQVGTPIMLISSNKELNQRVEGLNMGADDYLPKPYAIEELAARVNALVRRGGDARTLLLRVGDLSLDSMARVAHRGTRRIALASREYRLLEFLMRNKDSVCSRRQLLQHVWDYDFDPGTNLVEVTVRRLREKIEREGESALLKSARGVGYVMRSPAGA